MTNKQSIGSQATRNPTHNGEAARFMSLLPRPLVLPCCLLSIVHLCETLHPDPGLTACLFVLDQYSIVCVRYFHSHDSQTKTHAGDALPRPLWRSPAAAGTESWNSKSRGVGTVGQRVPLWGDRDAGLRSTARSSMSGEYLRQGYRAGRRGSFWSVLPALEQRESEC